jgi:uncharacterized cupin superfamily protein
MSTGVKPPALDPAAVAGRKGTGYPAPFRAGIKDREKRQLAVALGLNNFGVNLVRLPPGEISSQRHWHSRQDEFVYMLEGEVVLVSDGGEQVLTPGMCAGFVAGVPIGHRMLNRGGVDAVYLEVGDRSPDDVAHYPDIDLEARAADGQRYVFFHKDGSPY